MKSLDNEILITNLLIRISALEKVLINKGIVSLEELVKETKELTITLAKEILEKSNVGNIEQILSDLQMKDN